MFSARIDAVQRSDTVDLSRLFILEFTMFAEMAAGYLLCRFHVLKSSERSVLSRLVINLLLPCSIISSFSMEMNAEVLKRFLEILLISIGVQVMQTLIASIAFRSVPHEKRASLQYATVCSNAGFLGNAVAEGVYGAEGLLYTQIYLIPQRVVMWSAGVTYYAEGISKSGALKSILKHPCIIALEIGLLIMFLQIPVPAAVSSVLSALGRSSTPMVMVFLGMIMADAGFEGIVTKLNLKFAFLRLILIPCAVLAVCLLLHIDPMITGLSVILAAMPAGSTTAVLAEQYHADVEFAADCIVLTTLLSIALLPVWVYVLNLIL